MQGVVKDKKTVEPKQQRSCETKNRITEAASELFMKKSYEQVTVMEIARAAGISSSVFYRYFVNKKDVFYDVVREFASVMYDFSLQEVFSESSMGSKENVRKTFNLIIDRVIANHTFYKEIHNTFMNTFELCDEISKVCEELDKEKCRKIAEEVESLGVGITYAYEKARLISKMIDDFCHKIIFTEDNDLSVQKCRELLIDTIYYMIFEA